MVSPSQQTHRVRKRKHRKAGKKGRRRRIKRGTPKFPVDPT